MCAVVGVFISKRRSRVDLAQDMDRCRPNKWTCGFHKVYGFSCLAEEPLAYQECLFSMELADYSHASTEILTAQLAIARGTAVFRGTPLDNRCINASTMCVVYVFLLLSVYTYCCLCILIVRPCIRIVVYLFLLLSMCSYCSSMYSYRCISILIVVYVFLLFVHVFLSLSMYTYCCLCILRRGYPDWGFSVLFPRL
jgi:hypothetical protein